MSRMVVTSLRAVDTRVCSYSIDLILPSFHLGAYSASTLTPIVFATRAN